MSQPLTLKDEAGRAELGAWRPDVLIVVAYGLILPPAALAIPRLGCLNIHASLLPRWRAAAPIQRAILAGDARTGVTIMLMDVGLDTGPMLLKKEILIGSDETGGSLHDRLATLAGTALLEALQGHAAGTVRPTAQPAEGVTYAAKIDKAEALIDWTRGALEIERQVRAFNPWPVAETRLEGEQLRVFEAKAEGGGDASAEDGRAFAADRGASARDSGASAGDSHTPAEDSGKSQRDIGTIVAVRDDALIVQCGSRQARLAPGATPRPARSTCRRLRSRRPADRPPSWLEPPGRPAHQHSLTLLVPSSLSSSRDDRRMPLWHLSNLPHSARQSAPSRLAACAGTSDWRPRSRCS